MSSQRMGKQSVYHDGQNLGPRVSLRNDSLEERFETQEEHPAAIKIPIAAALL